MTRRLLFVVNQAGYFLSHRLPLALAARDAGWEVHVATARAPEQRIIAEAGLTPHDLPLSRAGLRPDKELRAILASWRLLRRLRPRVVHCVALKAVLAGGLAARLAGTPRCVIAIAGLGHLFIEGGAKSRLLRGLFRGLLRLLVGPRTRIIVQNDEDPGHLGLGEVARRRTVLIPGAGVDIERFRPTPEPDGMVTVLLGSRMLWTKGIGEYVEAARLLRDRGLAVRLLLAGDSDPGNPAAVPPARLESWNRDGAVEWLGQRDDMADLLASSHIACLPSYREGLPKSLIEATAAGRPIVATDVPGCRAVVRDGDNGLLVPARDAEALAEALARLVGDAAQRQRMGARGREIAIETFDLDKIIAATLSLYEDVDA